VRMLRSLGREVVGVDLRDGPFTSRIGSIADRTFARETLQGVDAVLHAATLHKPHVATHSRNEFVETNVVGTLNLLCLSGWLRYEMSIGERICRDRGV